MIEYNIYYPFVLTMLLLLLCDATEKTVTKQEGDASQDGQVLKRREHVQTRPVAVVQGKDCCKKRDTTQVVEGYWFGSISPTLMPKSCPSYLVDS